MKISKAEDQSLRLSTCLARAAVQLTLADLAARENLPEPTVAKLLSRLRQGDVVVAARGRHGGYELARPAAHISVAAVLQALGRPLLDGGGGRPSRTTVAARTWGTAASARSGATSRPGCRTCWKRPAWPTCAAPSSR